MIIYAVEIFKDSYKCEKVLELVELYIHFLKSNPNLEILNNICDVQGFTKDEVINIINDCDKIIEHEYIAYFIKKIKMLRDLCEDVIKNDKLLYCFDDELEDGALHIIKSCTYFKEDPNCPKCGKKMIKIHYGMPGPEILDKYEKGEIELGGCCYDKDNPKYYCKHCEMSYCDDLKTCYKKNKNFL